SLVPFAENEADHVLEPVRIAPLVVVPGHNLDLLAHSHGQLGVDDRRGGGADDIGGDEFVGGVFEVGRTLRGSCEHLVDLFEGGLRAWGVGAVYERSGGHWHAHGQSVELAGQVRHHPVDGAGGPRGGGHDVVGGGAGPAQVPVGAVDEHLVTGVGVDGVEQSGLDADGVIDGLDDGGHAVRRA